VKKTNWIPLVVVALTFGLAGYITTIACAQTASAPQQRPYQVAIVDIAQLIKNHPTFVAKQKELKKFADEKETEFNARKASIQDREKSLNELKLTPGTADHAKAVDEITTKITLLEKDVKIAQRQLMTDNSIVLYDVYKEIREEIDSIAKQSQIAQVMDYRTLDANPADPNAVAAMLEQNLIWHADSLEISQFVINRIYQKRNLTASIPDIKKLRDQEKQLLIDAKNNTTTQRTTTNTGTPTNTPLGAVGITTGTPAATGGRR
jgi:Skp family chaperone for outer membrane proteins